MLLERLTCRNFRCLEHVVFEPAEGVNVIRGKNGQGKTSLLEAVLYAATSKSHRTNTDSDLARRAAGEFHVELSVRRSDRTVRIEAHWHAGTKRFKVNGVAQTRISDILGKVNVVLFTPEDIELVKGNAGVRRRFMDMELSQLRPAYLNALQEYRTVLKQRNGTLRSPKRDDDLLAVYDKQLVRYGAVLIQERAAYLERLARGAEQHYGEIAGGERLSTIYRPDVKTAEDLEAALSRGRESDRKNGVTGRGPHRDDFEVEIASHAARSHGSQGQQKTAALALKLAHLDVVRQATGEYPILMLDEVLAELDEERARRLFEVIGPNVQCLVTTTNLHPERNGVLPRSTDFIIEAGRLKRG